MTDQEREEFRQYNGRMIEELCEIGTKVADEFVAGLPRSQWRLNDMRDYHE